MNGGAFTRLITIQSVPYYSDTDAGLVKSPAETYALRWARMETPSGSESFRFSQMQVAISHKLTLREYTPGVTENMQVLFGTRVFEIVSVLHDEARHRWTVLFCLERK